MPNRRRKGGQPFRRLRVDGRDIDDREKWERDFRNHCDRCHNDLGEDDETQKERGSLPLGKRGRAGVGDGGRICGPQGGPVAQGKRRQHDGRQTRERDGDRDATGAAPQDSVRNYPLVLEKIPKESADLQHRGSC